MEKVSVLVILVNIDFNFHSLLPNLRVRAEGIKITYICDNARKRIKIKIKKKEKT